MFVKNVFSVGYSVVGPVSEFCNVRIQILFDSCLNMSTFGNLLALSTAGSYGTIFSILPVSIHIFRIQDPCMLTAGIRLPAFDI
jgi:hypothetical protein